MKTFIRNIASVMLCAATLFGFSACSCDEPHETDGGVAIALDNSRCSDVAIGQTLLYIYDTAGNLVAKYEYDDARAVASALLPLAAGHYTMVTIVNADEEPSATASLTSLHEWVVAQSAVDADMLSGIADADVLEKVVTRVVVPLYKGSFTLPTLTVKFSLPETGMPDFTPQQAKSRAAAAGYVLRCVAEICKAGTDEVVLHKVVTPELLDDGTYKVELQLAEDNYDLRLWADYARTGAPLADTFYSTESLKAVNIVTEPYTANTDAKDAAYGIENGITVADEGETVTLDLQRPLAKYRIIVEADEIAEYLEMRKVNPQQFPPIEELTVNVLYEGFFPSRFNVVTEKPNDAVGGIAYSTSLSSYDGSATELELGSDWILVNGTSSFVNATVVVTDSQGRVISRVPGTQIDYRRNHLTTIIGRFLTSGANSGGIRIDTEWDGVYDVWF
ncbi:MAG: DUF6562 domain-containing protein [Candidatus Limisoma sp.]